jgi:hypothetical protein
MAHRAGWNEYYRPAQAKSEKPGNDENDTSQRRTFRSLEEARRYVRSLGLKRTAEGAARTTSGARPADIPNAPQQVYRGTWTDWGDWLGIWPEPSAD